MHNVHDFVFHWFCLMLMVSVSL